MKNVIDRKKIENQCKGLREVIKGHDKLGLDYDYMAGELHGLEMVLEGFYLLDNDNDNKN